MPKTPQNASYGLALFKKLIDERLEKLVPETDAILNEAARYMLLGGGKRLRPMLLLATLEILKHEILAGLDTACALEIIHTYSLIHDDLPCMDDDDFRRGRPTCHKAYNEAIALLAGDYLLTRAFEVISNDEALLDFQKVKIIQNLSLRAGGSGMIGGQTLDFLQTDKPTELSLLQKIHRLKTGALIESSIECALLIANPAPKVAEDLSEFARQFGLLFQIIDDILDVKDSLAKHGKNISSDIENNKSTYVSLLGYDQAIITAKETASAIEKLLNNLNASGSALHRIFTDTLSPLYS